jgi:Rad3-related DNA helicase
MAAMRASNDAVRPTDFGFPPKFSKYNEGQYDAALKIAASDKRFFILSAPTGAGKSIIYATVAKLVGGRTLILTGTNGLQSQLMADFAEAGLTDMRGQSNYRCVALDRQLRGYGRAGASCAEGPCKVGVFCSLKDGGGCGYFDAQRDALMSDFDMTNYAYWLSIGRHSDPDAIGRFDTLILDEAHDAKDWLADFCAVKLVRSEVRELIGMSLPRIDEGTAAWARWAAGALRETQKEQAAARDALQGLGGLLRQKCMDRLHRLSRLNSNLTAMASAGDWKPSEGGRKDVRMPGLHNDWVAEETKDGITYSPVWAHAYAEQVLFRGIKRVILVSATITKAEAKYLGIPADQVDYLEMPSAFEPKRRPFIYVPTTRVDRNMVEGQWNLLMAKVDRVIKARLDRKGIFHSRSYRYAAKIYHSSDHRSIMVTHPDSRTLRQAVDVHRRNEPPSLLVSPSVEQGFDFPGLECTYQIILKVPFPDMRSPVMKARGKSDPAYMNHLAATSITQMTGRGMRRTLDICETFIFDDHWMWFRNATPFARWFSISWRTWDEGLPTPPSLESLIAESKTPAGTKPPVSRRSALR